MSGLFGSLSVGARAVDGEGFGLDVTGQNIANVNTPGYTRRSALFEAVPPYDKWNAGNGVQIAGLRALRDERLESRLQQERPAEQRKLAIANTLAVVESALGKPGQSIDAALNTFFDSLGRLAADPTSAIERQTTVSQADALASRFKDMTSRLDQARRDADAGVRDGVAQVNDLAHRIAKLNESIAVASIRGAGVEELRDSLGEALKSLSGLVDIGTIPRADGGGAVSFGNGRPLVVGANTYEIDVTSTPPNGFAALMSDGTPVTSEVTGGSIAGLIQARDVIIPGYLDQLDTLAYSVVTQVNA